MSRVVTRTIVSSIPHTGTRSVEAFLKALNVVFTRYHIGTGWTSGGQNESMKFQHVVPMRDPANVYVSWYQRSEDLKSLQSRWGLLGSLLSKGEPSVIIPVDKGKLTHTKIREIGSFFSLPYEDVRATIMPHKGRTGYLKVNPTIPQWVEDLRKQWGYS